MKWDEIHASKDSWSKAVSDAQKLAKQAGAASRCATPATSTRRSRGGKTVEAFYTYPFVSHAPLEPQNCTAWFKDDSIEIWAPTQTPDAARRRWSPSCSALPHEKVTLHQMRVGGGFGRRLDERQRLRGGGDLEAGRRAGEAAVDARRRHGARLLPRGGFHSFKAAVDSAGKLAAWSGPLHHVHADGKKPVSGGDLSPDEFPALLLAERAHARRR